MRSHRAKGTNLLKRFATVWLLGILLCLGTGQNAEAAVWYVRTDGSDSNSGNSWDQALQNIRKAVEAAAYSDEIWVKHGTYQPSSYVLVDKAVKIYGGFAGVETERNQRDWRKNATTVDGGGVLYHCFYIDWAVDGVVIDGFTITGGNANGPDDSNPYRIHGSGGGIFNHQAASTIANCNFVNNKATQPAGGGGAIYVLGANAPTMTNCAFYNNEAVGDGVHGGAIHSDSSNPKMTNCVFSGNMAGGYGAAVYINGGSWNGEAAVTNCTFYNNNLSQAAAIYTVNYAHPGITNCILWGEATNPAPQIWADTSSLASVNFCNIQGGLGENLYGSGSGIRDQDPLFLDPANGDLHLLPNSPCVDAGYNAGVPSGVSTDFDGDSRIVNSTVDMGADEYKGVWYVDQALAQSSNGMFWSTAFKTIQEAVDAALDGHEIWVKQGGYPIASAISVGKALNLYGGFDGTERVREERQRRGTETIVDGQGLAKHCIYVTQNAVIDGFTITGGNASGSDADSRGGGLYISAPNAKLTNCKIQGNSANDLGGGLFNMGSGSVINCVFWDNQASSGGGAANSNCSPNIINCTFLGNTATTSGGAIVNVEASPVITNSILWGNAGGEIFNNGGSSPSVTYCDIDQDGYSGNANIRQDPKFVDPTSGDFHLRTDSPCIDAGNSAAVPLDVGQDLEGDSRALDGNGDDLIVVDMGADEYRHVPAIWHVDGTVAVSGDGRTWGAAFKTIEEAIDNPLLRDYDEIWVKSGRYIPPVDDWGLGHGWTNGEGLRVTKAIKLYGGFPSGILEPGWSDRNPRVNEAVIDANASQQATWGNLNRSFFIDSSASNFLEIKMGYPVIDGFTITGGQQWGSGFYILKRSPTITNCIIKGNQGAALLTENELAAPTIAGCLFSGNTAPTGSAILLLGPDWPDYHAKVINCTFSGNIATGASEGNGTIWVRRWYDSSIGGEFLNCIFWGNNVSGGAEIYFYNEPEWTTPAGSSIVKNCDIQGGSSQAWFNNGTNGTGNIDQDPHFLNPDSNDYRLSTLSPCIGAGDDTGVPADFGDLDRDDNTLEPLPFDLGGGPRFSETVDMGAYELNEVLLPGDVDGNQTVNLADAILALRILAGMQSGMTVNMGADVNGDGKIGFAEALYAIQVEAGLRTP